MEPGFHEELLRLDGRYAYMFRLRKRIPKKNKTRWKAPWDCWKKRIT